MEDSYSEILSLEKQVFAICVHIWWEKLTKIIRILIRWGKKFTKNIPTDFCWNFFINIISIRIRWPFLSNIIRILSKI